MPLSSVVAQQLAPSANILARCMSARTVQRRLTDADITFLQLVEKTRRALAHHYLKHSTIELKEAAFLLRYRICSR